MTRYQLNCSSLVVQFDFDLAKEGRRREYFGYGFRGEGESGIGRITIFVSTRL